MTHEVIKQAKQRMEKVEADLRAELSTLRTGRASVSILDHIKDVVVTANADGVIDRANPMTERVFS